MARRRWIDRRRRDGSSDGGLRPAVSTPPVARAARTTRRRSRSCPRGDHAYVSLAQPGGDPVVRSDARRRSRPSRTSRCTRRRRGATASASASIRGPTRPATTRASSSATRRGTSSTSTSSRATARCASSTSSIPAQEQECETNFDPLNPQIDPAMPVDVTPGNVCIPYGDVNRRPYSTGSTAGLRFPAVPIDVAAANLSGRHQRRHRQRWLRLGADRVGDDLPRQHQPAAAVDQGGRAQQPDAAVPVPDAPNPDEAFVYKNGRLPIEQPRRGSDAVPEPAARPQRDQLHRVARSVAGARAPRPTAAAAVDRSVHRTAVDAGDRGRRDRAGQPGAPDLRVLPRSQRRRRAGLGRHLGGDGRQPALLGHAERLDAEGRRRRILLGGRAARRHRHVARLHDRCGLSAGTGLRPRSVARSGARRIQGHRPLHEQEPHGGATRRLATSTPAACAATRSPSPARAS